MSALRRRTQEINAEYWATRETMSERVCVAQLCIALARAEMAVADQAIKVSPCSICGDPEPAHVHGTDGERINDYFTVGRGETDFQAAQRWKARALAIAEPAL